MPARRRRLHHRRHRGRQPRGQGHRARVNRGRAPGARTRSSTRRCSNRSTTCATCTASTSTGSRSMPPARDHRGARRALRPTRRSSPCSSPTTRSARCSRYAAGRDSPRGGRIHAHRCRAGRGLAPLSLDALGVDALTLAGHKVGAPKGTGALVVRRASLEPVLHGGPGARPLRAPRTSPARWRSPPPCASPRPERADAAARAAVLGVSSSRGSRAGCPERCSRATPSTVPGTASFVFPGTSGEAVLLERARRRDLLERPASRRQRRAVARADGDGIPGESRETAVRFTPERRRPRGGDGCCGRRLGGVGGARYRSHDRSQHPRRRRRPRGRPEGSTTRWLPRESSSRELFRGQADRGARARAARTARRVSLNSDRSVESRASSSAG